MMLPYASSSSSSTTVSQGCDVFISFRGEDTRRGFISHLYDALTRNKIRTFKDDRELEIGRPIASELQEAIESSKIAVVVLSKSFATSKWCLEEIAKIVHCMKQGKLITIPIFYHVAPTDVRHQSKCFKQGFSDHEKDPQIAPQQVETWRSAFREVGALNGTHVTEHKDEAEIINEILRKISRELPDSILPISNNLVGIESRADELKRMLRMDSSEVLFVGICGMSGVGKTTLAEVVYQGIKSKFERSSLIENIKDISKQNDSTGLCKLQEKLLHDILGEKNIRVRSVSEGQALLGVKLRGLKVLVVLDDVNHVDQLAYLAGGREWFGSGTRIIVTTTNTDLLNWHKITDIYLCEELKGDEALGLFCQSAFEQSHPAHGYEKLSDDIVHLTGGLPLALNVYGSLLYGKDESYWKEKLKKLGEFSDKEVLERLEVVFTRLDDDQRDAFIYIACFLRGRNKDLVIDILTDIDLYPKCGIADLMNRCLITINIEDNVWMHDLLQQMCWKILCKESNRYEGMHIAIKYHKDIVDILSSKPKGMRTIKIINQEPYKGEVNDHFFDPMCFSKMTKLKFLRISNVHFPNGLEYLSNDLRILEWYGCSLKSLPSMFEPKHIYELAMCSSQLQKLWKKDLELPNLRSINLSFSKDLTEIPDLKSAPMLVKLNLEGCIKLVRLHESVLLHKKLRYLNLKGCTCVESLGGICMEMEALEALILSGCSKLKYFPEFGKKMKRLEYLYVDGTRIKKLPENMGQMCDLRILDTSGTLIEELPPSIHLLKKLRLLHVTRCQLSFKSGGFLYRSLGTLSFSLRDVDLSYCNLSVVPDGIGLLCNIITLDLSGNEFVWLPASIGLLSKLRMLCLNNCMRLQSLPKLSLVDEDMDYGPRSRFHYYFATGLVNVSKFLSSSYNNGPTAWCLNCPNLAVNKRGGDLAEKILNNYVQLRTKYWMTPEAVFEILGAGSKIPTGFVQPGPGGLILEGPWIGVAICALIAAHHPNGYMEAKTMVTAHIHLGGKQWKIVVPVYFLGAESERQLVFYWTVADDLQRIVDSCKKSIFDVSFSMEPDSSTRVIKYGVRFINEEYIMSLKQHKASIAKMLSYGSNLNHLPKWYMDYCRDDTNLHYHIGKLLDFILEYGSQEDSLDSIYQITKTLVGINQQLFGLFSGYKGKRRYKDCVYPYCVFYLGASVLYSDFVRSLKDINEGWLGVKSALELIVVKSRWDSYSYKEMLQQLNDLEAATSVGFSGKFIQMIESVFAQASYIVSLFNEFLPPDDKQLRVLAKLSSIPIVGVLCMMVVYMGDFELLKKMKHIAKNILVLHLFQAVADKKQYFTEIGWRRSKLELQILVFYENGILLQDLRNTMSRSSCFTKDNEEQMMIVIGKLLSNIHKASYTIRDMGTLAVQYSHDIEKAWKHVKFSYRFSGLDDILHLLPY